MTPSRLDKLHIYLCIVAAFTVTVVCIVRNESLYRLAIWVILTVAVFYIVGQAIRMYISSYVFPKPDEGTLGDESDTDQDGAEAETPAASDTLSPDDAEPI
jgi:hypothetical protein